MPKWGMKMLRGAPKYFLALKGGGGSESSRYTEGGAINFSKFWSSRDLECSLQIIVNRIDGLETH